MGPRACHLWSSPCGELRSLRAWRCCDRKRGSCLRHQQHPCQNRRLPVIWCFDSRCRYCYSPPHPPHPPHPPTSTSSCVRSQRLVTSIVARSSPFSSALLSSSSLPPPPNYPSPLSFNAFPRLDVQLPSASPVAHSNNTFHAETIEPRFRRDTIIIHLASTISHQLYLHLIASTSFNLTIPPHQCRS